MRFHFSSAADTWEWLTFRPTRYFFTQHLHLLSEDVVIPVNLDGLERESDRFMEGKAINNCYKPQGLSSTSAVMVLHPLSHTHEQAQEWKRKKFEFGEKGDTLKGGGSGCSKQ